MAVPTKPKKFEMMSDLLDRLGGISPQRVCLTPSPGKATEKDLLRLQKQDGSLLELVDGTLVEKPAGQVESFLTVELAGHLGNFLESHALGYLTGPDGMMRVVPQAVRLPDISFVSFDQLPTREINTEAIGPVSPYLAVEVISEGNTKEEIDRKRGEYFRGGTRLMWVVYPKSRTVEVWTAADQCVTLTEEDTLSGGAVLPGFELSVRRLFAKLPAGFPRSAKKKPGGADKCKRRGKK